MTEIFELSVRTLRHIVCVWKESTKFEDATDICSSSIAHFVPELYPKVAPLDLLYRVICISVLFKY